MSRRAGTCWHFPRRFPRLRGDEPRLLDCPALYKWVFPAYAGMSPRRLVCASQWERFPRLRGDEPWGREKAKAEALFSPPTRG